IEGRDDAALRHIGGLGGREYLFVTDIAHELGGERNGTRAVIDDGDFELADLATIEARRLPAGERRGGLRGRGERRKSAGGGGCGGRKQAATGPMGPGVSSVMASSGKQRLATTAMAGGGRRRCYSFKALDRRPSAAVFCARAASGHAAAEPPSSVMKSQAASRLRCMCRPPR